MRDKITVTIDSDLQDIIPGYLENRKKDIMDIRTAIISGDFEDIRITGHGMKGSGGGYGFDEISTIGAKIETAAKEKNVDSIEKELLRLDNYMHDLQVQYED